MLQSELQRLPSGRGKGGRTDKVAMDFTQSCTTPRREVRAKTL